MAVQTSSLCPELLVYEPLLQPHLQTLIILHGRGSNANKFAPPLLATPVETHRSKKEELSTSLHHSSSACNLSPPITDQSIKTSEVVSQEQQILRTLFPHARFVFPTARPLRAKLYKRKPIHQWFDAWRLPFQPAYVRRDHRASHEEENEEEGGRVDSFRKSDAEVEREKESSKQDMGWENEDLQAPGLRETSLDLSDLVEREYALLHSLSSSPSASAPSLSPNTNPTKPRTNQEPTLLIGGLSQGAAAVLTAILACPEIREKVNGIFGLCGYLPFADTLKVTADTGGTGDEDDDDDMFEREDRQGLPSISAVDTATDTLREILGLPPLSSSSPSSPSSAPSPTLSSSIPENTPPLPPIFLAHGTHDAKVDIRLARVAKRCIESLASEAQVEEKVDVDWYEEWGLGHWYSGEMLGRLVGWIERISSRTGRV